MHSNVHSSTIFNSQLLEAPWVPISKWMDQKTMVHLHDGILHSRKKEGAPTLRDSMDGTGEHYAKWNKPGSKGQIPYDLTFKWNLTNKTNKETEYNQRHWNKEQTDSDQRGWGGGLRKRQVKEPAYSNNGHGQWSGVDCRGVWGRGEQQGKRWDNSNWTTIKNRLM